MGQKSRCQKCQRSPKMKKNQKTKKKNQKTKKKNQKTKKKNQKMKKRSQKTKKWKIQKKPFLEMMENGQNANRNQLKMVKSHARALSVLFSVWRVSKSKEMPRLNAKKIKKESGNSTSHSVLVSEVKTSLKMKKKNQKTKKKNQKTKK